MREETWVWAFQVSALGSLSCAAPRYAQLDHRSCLSIQCDTTGHPRKPHDTLFKFQGFFSDFKKTVVRTVPACGQVGAESGSWSCSSGLVVLFRSSRNSKSLHCHLRQLHSYHRQSTTNAAQLMPTYASVSCINSIFRLMPSFTNKKKQPLNNFPVIFDQVCERRFIWAAVEVWVFGARGEFRLLGLDLSFRSLRDGLSVRKHHDEDIFQG